MNAKMKKRLMVVSGIIVIVLIVVLAVVGGSTAAKTMGVAEAVENPPASDQKVQVSGNVVADSFSTDDNVLTFKIYDPDGASPAQLEVRYEGAASSTFGNDVTAICTGRINDDGVLVCSELVTKCPSKYENAEDALSVASLLGYGDDIVGKMVKVSGSVEPGTLSAAGQGDRFVIVDAETGDALPVAFDGALSDDVRDDAMVVLTGSLGGDGKFAATDVALEG